jgi:cytochrome c-type biogenesis protein CcmH/NrfG
VAGWLHLGIVYTQLQLWEPAEGALRQTLNLDPQSAEATDWLQRVAKRKGAMERLESSPPDNSQRSKQ